MGSIARLILGTPIAGLVTALLFLFMAAMIRSELRLEEERENLNISITAQLQDTDLNQANKEFKRPTLDTPPPPPPAVTDPTNRPDVSGVSAEIPQIETDLEIGTNFNPDRDAQPLVRIEPQYPDRCQGRAGAVVIVQVEFDVTPDGETANARVIESSNSCFNRSAVRAVGRWKYQPKIVDQKAEWRRGVITQFRFELAE
ncbi:MAG: TonB family protein [Pseudomonadota bacterium]